MSFAQGMNVGSNMALGAHRAAMMAAENQRTQTTYDRRLQAEDDAARIMGEAQGELEQQTAQALPYFQEGPPTAVQQPKALDDLYGPPVAPPSPAQAMNPDFSRQSQARLAMRLATANRDAGAFMQASAANADAGFSTQMAQLMNRIQSGDPRILDPLIAKVNSESPDMTILKGADGYEMIAVSPDGSARKYAPSLHDLSKIAVGNAMVHRGDLGGGLKMLDGVQKDIADAMKLRFDQLHKVTTANNTAAHYGNADAIRRATLDSNEAIRRDTLDANEAYRRESLDLRRDALAQRGNFRPPKIEEDGTYGYLPNGMPGMWQGGKILSQDAPHPRQRKEALTKWGADANMIELARGELVWNEVGPNPGTEVVYHGKAYSVLEPSDASALNKAIQETGKDKIVSAEIALKDRTDRSNYERGQNTITFNRLTEVEPMTSAERAFVRAIRGQESSNGANTATSNRGARGDMQVTPNAFKDVADPGWDYNNPEHVTRAGIRYALKGLRENNGDRRLAAAYYYGGPVGAAKLSKGIAVTDSRNPQAPDTSVYARKVGEKARALDVGMQDPSRPAIYYRR